MRVFMRPAGLETVDAELSLKKWLWYMKPVT